MNVISIPNKSGMIEVDLIIRILSNLLKEQHEIAVGKLEKDMQRQSTPFVMKDVRWVLESRFEHTYHFCGLGKETVYGICGKDARIDFVGGACWVPAQLRDGCLCRKKGAFLIIS